MKNVISCICFLLFSSIAFSQTSDIEPTYNLNERDLIVSALDYQIREYPASQLKDVYKNFMQDYFGPGHILSDTVAAATYLRKELTETTLFLGPLYEKTGYEGNFYRVNLSLIKDDIIPYQEFFNAFVESVQGIVPPDNSIWIDKWRKIEKVIEEEGYRFCNQKADSIDLDEQFSHGNFIVHHSERFNDNYNFHYRIISKDLFKTRILPYLAGHKKTEWD